MEWDTLSKNIARGFAVRPVPLSYNGSSRRHFARTVLSLPGDRCLCLRSGQQTGFYRDSTFHVLAERDRPAQAAIAGQLPHVLKSEPYFHRGSLHTLDLLAALGGRPLDFAYLDLCGSLRWPEANWIRQELGAAFAPGAGLAVTLTRNWRNSKFMQLACGLLRRSKDGREFFQQMVQKVQKDRGICHNTATRYWRQPPPPGEPLHLTYHLMPVIHQTSLEIISCLQLLLPGYRFRIDSCIEYRRDYFCPSHNMVTIRLLDLHLRRSPMLVSKLSDELFDQQPIAWRAAA